MNFCKKIFIWHLSDNKDCYWPLQDFLSTKANFIFYIKFILGDSAPSSLSPRGREYRQTQGSPRISDGSKFARSNGHRQRAGSATPSIASSSGGGVDSPSRSIASRSSNSRNTPTSGKMITREDLRRMNRSTPSTKKEKQPSSYSRTSIPMSWAPE